jgi:NAD(P)-dependent dehydrogenase (short-subunit alcohol dehydrogenase family)
MSDGGKPSGLPPSSIVQSSIMHGQSTSSRSSHACGGRCGTACGFISRVIIRDKPGNRERTIREPRMVAVPWCGSNVIVRALTRSRKNQYLNACGHDQRIEPLVIMNPVGKTFLVTGSTDGVGRVVAARLGAAGANVLLHGRDAKRGGEIVDGIRRSGGTAAFHSADLSSLDGVRKLANVVRENHDRLDVLVNNAGIGSATGDRQRRESADGYELRFAVNYLATFLLTRLLLPLVRASTPARIVNVASLGQHPIDFDDVMLTRSYDGSRAYAQSKLAQIMFTFDLARELDGGGVTANCLHPATYMDTTMVRAGGITPVSTVDEGADAILKLAISDELEGKTGLFFDRQRLSRANAQAYDEAALKRLSELSYRLTGLAAAGTS